MRGRAKSKIAFIDPHLASQQSMDACERFVEDYLVSVMEKSKDKELILWPFNSQ